MESLTALGDPTRQRILKLLARGGMNSGDIARRLPISAPAVSQHLKTLRAAKLVRVQVRAQQRFYELDQTGLLEVAAWIARLTQFWNARLAALEAELTKPILKKEKKR